MNSPSYRYSSEFSYGSSSSGTMPPLTPCSTNPAGSTTWGTKGSCCSGPTGTCGTTPMLWRVKYNLDNGKIIFMVTWVTIDLVGWPPSPVVIRTILVNYNVWVARLISQTSFNGSSMNLIMRIPKWARCPQGIIYKNVQSYPKKQQDTKTIKERWITRTQVFPRDLLHKKKKIIYIYIKII